MKLQSLIRKLPENLAFVALKILHARKGLKLEEVKRRENGRFWIYKVDGFFLPLENPSWHIDFNSLQENVYKISLFKYKPKQDDVIIDIGAGLGEESLVYSKLVGQSGRVYAIEANPIIYSILKEVIKLNRIENINLQNLALSDKSQSVKITDELNSYLSGNTSANSKKGTVTYEVNGITFHTFIKKNKITKVDLLKVNIEGAERFLIKEKFEEFRIVKNIAISCHDFRYKKEGVEFFRTKELIKSFLIMQGFKLTNQNTTEDYIDDWIYGER